MAVKLFICIKCTTVVAYSTNIQLAGKLHVHQMFVKEADGIVSYLKPGMEIVGG